jgi:hypothetical protein
MRILFFNMTDQPCPSCMLCQPQLIKTAVVLGAAFVSMIFGQKVIGAFERAAGYLAAIVAIT